MVAPTLSRTVVPNKEVPNIEVLSLRAPSWAPLHVAVPELALACRRTLGLLNSLYI